MFKAAFGVINDDGGGGDIVLAGKVRTSY